MAQQLNLFDQRFAPQSQRYSARHGLLAMVLTLGLTMAGAQLLQASARRSVADAQALEAANAPLRQQLLQAARQPNVNKGPDAELELAQLRALESSQRRIRAALEAGVAGTREGHAGYLAALARQANGQVWITGFQVTEGGGQIDLEGRMLDSAALTDYLRRLNSEARFRGRPFSQLSLHTAQDGNGGALPYTEFTLRAHAPLVAPEPSGPADVALATPPGQPGGAETGHKP